MLQMEVGDISSSQPFHWKTRVLSQMKFKKKEIIKVDFPVSGLAQLIYYQCLTHCRFV